VHLLNFTTTLDFEKARTLKNKKGCNKFNAGEFNVFDGKIFASQNIH